MAVSTLDFFIHHVFPKISYLCLYGIGNPTYLGKSMCFLVLLEIKVACDQVLTKDI